MTHSAETWLKNFSPVQVQFLDFRNAFFFQWLRRLIRDEIYWLIMRERLAEIRFFISAFGCSSPLDKRHSLLLLSPGGFFFLVNLVFFFSHARSRHCAVESHQFWLGRHLAKILACAYHRFQMLLYFTTTTSLPHCSKAREALVYNPHSISQKNSDGIMDGGTNVDTHLNCIKRDLAKECQTPSMPDVFFHGN